METAHDKIEKILKDFYGDNYEFLRTPTHHDRSRMQIEEMICGASPSHGFPITVFFEKITVKNPSRVKHDVREVYLRFYVDQQGRVIDNRRSTSFFGIRTAATPQEIQMGYIHSHPRAPRDLRYFTPFCFGNGPMVSLTLLCGELFEEHRFKAFLVGMKAYMEWEQSGYEIIYKLGSGTYSFPELPQDYLDLIVRNCRKVPLELLRITFGRNGFEVLPTVELERYIAKETRSVDSRQLAYKSEDGKFYRRGKAEPPSKNPILYFRGEPKYFKVLDQDNPELLRPNPVITSAVCKHFQNLLNRHAISKLKNKSDGKGAERTDRVYSKPGI